SSGAAGSAWSTMWLYPQGPGGVNSIAASPLFLPGSNCEQLLRRLARRGCGEHAGRRSRRAAAGAATRWPRAQGDCMLPRPKRNELTTTRYDAVPGTTGTLATKGSVALGRRRELTWVSPRESTLPLSFRASAVT